MLMKDHGKEVPNPETDACWLKWLHDSGFDTLGTNGPKPGTPDHLEDDQSRMTYSFNIGEVHFIVINTDTLTTEKDHGVHSYPGWFPYNWIKQDVRNRRMTPASKPFS